MARVDGIKAYNSESHLNVIVCGFALRTPATGFALVISTGSTDEVLMDERISLKNDLSSQDVALFLSLASSVASGSLLLRPPNVWIVVWTYLHRRHGAVHPSPALQKIALDLFFPASSGWGRVLTRYDAPVAPPPDAMTFEPLPKAPKWRTELLQRARRAGLGRIGRAVEWVLGNGNGNAAEEVRGTARTRTRPATAAAAARARGAAAAARGARRSGKKFSLSFPLILHSLPAFFTLCCTLPYLWTPPWTPLTLLDTLTPTTNTPNDAQRTISQMSAHLLKLAKFLVRRALRPYVNEGAGVCYNVACAQNSDIDLFRTGRLTGAEFLARIKWKVGHTRDWQRRQREYAKCDAKQTQTHIWNGFAQLLQLCHGGQLIVDRCVCGVQHREYFEFSTVGGFAEFSALMTTVITCMNEPLYGVAPLAGVEGNKARTELGCSKDKAAVRYRSSPRGIPTTTPNERDEDNVQVGFGVDKGDVRAGSHGNTRDPWVGFDADKGDPRVGFDVDKDTAHKVRRGLGYGAWDGRVSRHCVRKPQSNNVRVGFGVDKGDVRVGSHGDTRDPRVGLNANKDVPRVGFDVDKDTAHKARRGLGYEAWDGLISRRCVRKPRSDNVRVGFGVGKGDVRVGSHGDTRDLWVGFDADKGDPQVGFDVDKDTAHKARRGLGYEAWDGRMSRHCVRPAVHGMGAWGAAA
ncbi:hypothetical protein B0H14DRAFT_3489614 [Mycena olivaceomarginata]|nr:hypothetical protein B0H14DRAFT_3489614 [Mycena olivaceomarginata]